MKKIWLVLLHEVVATITRRSFLLTAFGVPIVSTVILLGVTFLNRNAPSAIEQVVGGNSSTGPSVVHPEGLVDQSGLIRQLPNTIQPGALVLFPNEAAARQALSTGRISGFYVVSKDYLQSGMVTNVRNDFNPLTDINQSSAIQSVLRYNLLNGEPRLVQLVQNPLTLQVQILEPTTERDQNDPLTFFIPYIVTMIYYFIILTSSSLLLNSVTKEKENRVVEILMASITPRQMLTGKIIGLGLVGLLQTVVWIGTGYGLLRLSGQTFNIPEAFQLPSSILLWGVVFFLLGYAVYASLMAAVGALVQNLREASQATFVIILPMLIPLVTISVLIADPNGPLATGLSLFPLTAPVTMMARLVATRVPVWQSLLSAALLVLTAGLIVRAVAGLFRAQILLSGQSFELKQLFNALLGRI